MKQFLQLFRPFREMRKMAFFSFVLFAFIAIPIGMRGQTSVTWPGTTALPGTATAVANDQNVTIMVSSTNTYSNPIRIYANTTVTINALNNAKILSVAYEASSTGNYVTNAQNATVTPNVTPTVSDKIVTWTYAESANVTEFTFKPSAQTRSNGITITYIIPSSTPTCTTPTFSPSAGTYTQAQNVTISCTTEDATIYYTTDGNAPTTSSTVYSAPINVSSNTTIKAMAAKSGYDNSSIATAEYAFITLDHAGTLADPYTVADAHTAIDANAGTQNVYVTGIVSDIPTEYNSTYGNITFNMVDEEGDEVFLQAYRCGGDEAANVAVGDIAVVYGNLIKYGSTYEFGSGCTLVSLTHPVVTTPTVTVTPATINAPAEGADGTLALTYENIEEFIGFDYYFCDADGNALEGDAPNWIYAEINGENDAYTLSYIIDANDGAARTAYLKVYTFDDNSEEVFAIVTVNQEEFVAPTYAELPFEFNGGIADIESTDGLYQEGLGTDYNASNNPYTKLKFDGTGDWLLLQFSERPGTLTFNIKNNSFSGGTFKVQTSEDGVSYIDLETYTEISGTQNEEFTDLGENVRYIKWIYTNKSSGNVGLGNIALAEYVAPQPAITLNSYSIEAPAAEIEGTLAVTYTEIETSAGVGIYWYEADGTTEATYNHDWIQTEINSENNVYYLIGANEGAARTAYFKLYGVDADLNDVYSDLVTVTQAAPVVPPTPGNWMLTNLSDLTEDDVFVIVGDNGGTYAMSNDKGTSSAPTAVAVTVVEGTLSEEPAINLQWNLAITDDGYVFYPNGTTESWLYCTNTNNGVRVGTNTNNVFVLDDESNYLKNDATSRYLGVYNSQDWRCYINTTGNIDDQTFAFYKKVEPVEPVVYFFEGTGDCETVSLQGSSVTLPLATISCSDWAFAGWATSPVNETTSAPTLYTGTYAPTEDIFLYAIYQNNGTYNSFPACVYTQLDVTEGFESYTESHIPRTFVKPTGWTVVAQNVPARSKMGRPQVLYYTLCAHESDYSLFMDTLSVLAMPKLDNGISFSGLEMELYLRQASDHQYLEIGVMSDLADPESFEVIETISNVGSAVNRRVVDFSGYHGEGRYIAFRNAYSGEGGQKSYNYLDDIVFRLKNLTCGIMELPYTQDFDNLTDITDLRTGIQPECWTEAQRYANYAAAYEPQLFYAAAYAHSGYYTLQLDGLCIYAMPELKVPDKSVQDMQLEFYVRQYSSDCSLEVGVMSNLNDANSFVALATVSNNGVSGSKKHVVDFGQYAEDIPSGAKYIAFRNIYNGAWNRSPQNIDDINLIERVEDNCDITELPYTQDFDNLTDITELRTGIQPECWTEAHRYANYAVAYEPQLTYGAAYAHSGYYTLQLDGQCIYAMPELKVPGKSVRDMQLEFYVRQYSANCLLEVGVMSNLNDANSFVALATVSNNGVSGSQKHVVDFGQYADDIPSGTKYIAFRNIYNGAWNRSPQNIDDINLIERVEDNCGIMELPYTQNFDNLTDITDLRTGIQPECWTEAHRYANYAAAYEPQLIYGAAYAHSGYYTLQLDGLCIYAMPELKVPDKSIQDMQLEFYVRQYSADCSLEVGVMSNLNNANSFVALDTVSNNGVSGSQKHVVNFSQYADNIPSGAKYIAFRNIYNGAWNRSPQNIDDITLFVPEAKIAEVSSENVIDANSVERYLEDIRVYPNPTTGNLYIDAMDVQKVECYNQMGQLVGVYDNANELNISDLSNGVYMLRITVPQGVTMRKVVKK